MFIVDIIVLITNFLVRLRYKINITGIDKVKKSGEKGILFLPNHPALMDPIIVVATLFRKFRIRPIGHADQLDRPVIGWAARKMRVLTMPSLSKEGVGGAAAIKQTLDKCIEALNNGDNVLMYPSGALYRSKYEKIGTNSGVEQIVKAVPDVQIVLVRSRGLWGSMFSWGYEGTNPLAGRALKKGIKGLLLSGIFFMPKRKVTLEIEEPTDFPYQGDRREINSYLEDFYNKGALNSQYVPYSIWDRSGYHELPEPQIHKADNDTSLVPAATRKIVTEFIIERIGISSFDDNSSLAGDLGMDSLAVSEIAIWIENEFGFPQTDIESLQTVGDLMLAACGQAVSAARADLLPVPEVWFKETPKYYKPANMADINICKGFLDQARRQPDKVILADQNSGVKTNRDLILAIMVLKPEIEKLPGKYVGIMLPASVGVPILYLSVMFAGKIPVMVNWTQGRKNLQALMEKLEVSSILTSKVLLEKLKGQGVQLDSIEERFVCLEDIGKKVNLAKKIWAKVKSKVSWSELEKVEPEETAVVLFTSGSENIPKAVPLTHRNIMADVDSLLEYFNFGDYEVMLGILPPFHSFGLTGLIVVPTVLGVRAVYSPNPNEGGVLARTVNHYKATFMLGTPTFLNGIVRAAAPGAVSSVKTIITGAEKCQPHVYDALEKACPDATVQEAYGITECSPGVSVNPYDKPKRETIGQVIRCMEYAIVDPDTCMAVEQGQRGLLLVRGDNVFPGYLKHDGPSPFVEYEGKMWYNTGDLVIEDSDHILTFAGRLKRFVKLGGEMISLPAIEEVLNKVFVTPEMSEDGPVFAVLPSNLDENPELVLFSRVDIEREQVNVAIRDSGLSGLHNIREIRKVDEMPLLGSGKQDYRKLAEMLIG